MERDIMRKQMVFICDVWLYSRTHAQHLSWSLRETSTLLYVSGTDSQGWECQLKGHTGSSEPPPLPRLYNYRFFTMSGNTYPQAVIQSLGQCLGNSKCSKNVKTSGDTL